MIEVLEDRRLMSVRPYGVVKHPVPIDTAPLIHKGVLNINGSAGDDNISVHLETTPSGMQVDVQVVSGQTVDGKLNGKVTRSILVPAADVQTVVVDGRGGNDQLDTDVTAYKFTKSVDIDTRVLSTVKKTGRTVFSEDPMSQPLPGVLGGSTTAWTTKSYGEIRRLSKSEGQSTVLFLGDSHINYLPQTGAEIFKEKFGTLPNINLGLPGDTASQMLYRIEQQNMLHATSAKLVVLEIGSNNVALSDDVNAIARSIAAVVSAIRARMPFTKILLNSVLPARNNADNKVINKVNDRIAALNNGHGIRFLNLTPSFSSTRAQQRYYRPDNNIHLNSNGYSVWVNQLAPVMDMLLGV